MANKTYPVHLTDDERTELGKIAQNKRSAKLAKLRAQILLLSDTNLPHDKGASRTDTEIVTQLGHSIFAVRETRKRAHEHGVLNSLKRQSSAQKPAASHDRASETVEELDWEEEDRIRSMQLDKLAEKNNLKEENEKVKADIALRSEHAFTLFEAATRVTQPQSHPNIAAMDLELARQEDLTPEARLVGIEAVCQAVEPLIQSLISMMPRQGATDSAATVENSTTAALKDGFRRKLEKAAQRAMAARLKRAERATPEMKKNNWQGYCDVLEDYFQVINEVYEDVKEAIAWLYEQNDSRIEGINRAAKPLVTALLSTQSARDKAQTEAAKQAAEIERMRRSGHLLIPPYNIRCFAGASGLSWSTVKKLIPPYIKKYKDSDFPSQFRNEPTRQEDEQGHKGGYITDDREDARRFYQSLWDRPQRNRRTTKPKAAPDSR